MNTGIPIEYRPTVTFQNSDPTNSHNHDAIARNWGARPEGFRIPNRLRETGIMPTSKNVAGREKEAREQPLVLEAWLDNVVVRRVENSESSSPRTSSMNTTKNYLAESGLPMRSLSLSWIVIPTNISCNTCMWERTIEHMHDDRPIMHP